METRFSSINTSDPLTKETDMMTRSMNPRVVLAVIAIVLAGSFASVAQDDAAQEEQTLSDRLGGLAAISVVVSDFVDALVPDATLNANPAIDASRERVPSTFQRKRSISGSSPNWS